jgi:hypothetical protein
MANREEGGMAFPGEYTTKDFYGRETAHVTKGMTLRDWFAGKALSGHYANWGDRSVNEIAALSYTMADAMIAARKAR